MPKKHILDNEVSEAMTNIIWGKYSMEMELMTPGSHRRNAAEVAIRNFKAHFLSVLAGTAKDFLPSLWYRLHNPADRNHSESLASIGCSAKHVGICTFERTFDCIQQDATSANGMCSASA